MCIRDSSRTYNPLRIYEGYGQKQQDALPAADNNALRYVYGTRSAPYSYGKGCLLYTARCV